VQYELKYRAPPGRAALVRTRLDAACPPDPQFPSGTVWTIYFDTPAFDLLREKIEGHCHKRKVRLRWYDDLGTAFAEVKYRFGAARDKLRLETPVAPSRLSRCRLDDDEVCAALDPLREAGARLPVPLHPVMTIRFRRRRYVDPISGARVSIDDEIAVSAVNPRFFRGCRPGPLPFSVIEVKGPACRLPPTLSGMLAPGLTRASVSKYAECYRHLPWR
jgi:hypothetical protein